MLAVFRYSGLFKGVAESGLCRPPPWQGSAPIKKGIHVSVRPDFSITWNDRAIKIVSRSNAPPAGNRIFIRRTVHGNSYLAVSNQNLYLMPHSAQEKIIDAEGGFLLTNSGSTNPETPAVWLVVDGHLLLKAGTKLGLEPSR